MIAGLLPPGHFTERMVVPKAHSLQRLGKGLGAIGRSVGSKEYSKEYSKDDSAPLSTSYQSPTLVLHNVRRLVALTANGSPTGMKHFPAHTSRRSSNTHTPWLGSP